MNVIYSQQVKDTLSDYAKSLKKYPISKERRIEKRKAISKFLKYVLPKFADSCNVCLWKDLGQVLDINGNPINKRLKMKQYKDESNSPWMISFMKDSSNKHLIIYRMVFSENVKENKLQLVPFFEEFYSMI